MPCAHHMSPEEEAIERENVRREFERARHDLDLTTRLLCAILKTGHGDGVFYVKELPDKEQKELIAWRERHKKLDEYREKVERRERELKRVAAETRLKEAEGALERAKKELEKLK